MDIRVILHRYVEADVRRGQNGGQRQNRPIVRNHPHSVGLHAADRSSKMSGGKRRPAVLKQG